MQVPADCPIEINGRGAKLEDLRVGDACSVRAVVSWGRAMPLWVHVTRADVDAQPAATQPATTQPAEPG